MNNCNRYKIRRPRSLCSFETAQALKELGCHDQSADFYALTKTGEYVLWSYDKWSKATSYELNELFGTPYPYCLTVCYAFNHDKIAYWIYETYGIMVCYECLPNDKFRGSLRTGDNKIIYQFDDEYSDAYIMLEHIVDKTVQLIKDNKIKTSYANKTCSI